MGDDITVLLFLLQSILIVLLFMHCTRLRQAEKTAQTTLVQYQTFFENFPLGVTISDRHGRIVKTNRQAELLLGLPKQEHEARRIDGPEWQILRSDGSLMPSSEYPASQAMRSGSTISHAEIGVVRTGGDIIWLTVTAAPIPLEGYGAAIVYEDITERKQTEEDLNSYRDQLEETIEEHTAELAEERNLLWALLNNMPDLILIKDAETRFLALNPALAHLMGAAAPDDLLGKTDFDFYPRAIAQHYYDLERRMLQTGEPSLNQEELHHDPDTGEERWFLATKLPFRDQRGRILGLVGISRDITEHKQLEETLRNQRDHLESLTADLETANRELKDFAYIVSHDLKAPLRAISRLAAWLVEDYAGAFDAKGKDMADLLIGRVMRMDSLIDGILEYSRIGRIVGQDSEIDVDRLLKNVIDTLAPPPGIRIDHSCRFPMLVGDATRVGQVFQNLIGNAVKFIDSPRQGLIRIRCSDTGDYWQFSISDNGPGIDKKYHERIFEIFQTLKPRDEVESTGIGLSIAKKIIEFYGGKIWVESTVSEGSCFYFTLPKSQAHRSAI